MYIFAGRFGAARFRFWIGEFASLAAESLGWKSPTTFHLGASACAYHMNVITHLCRDLLASIS